MKNEIFTQIQKKKVRVDSKTQQELEEMGRVSRVAQRYLTAGYTHYWKMSRDFTNQEWSKILKGAEKELWWEGDWWVAGAQGKGEPELKRDYILFNGDLDQGEDFYLTKKQQDFAFCKTYRYEYDAAVGAILELAQKIAPDAITVS